MVYRARDTKLIYSTAKIGKNVRIFPRVYIGKGCVIGKGTVIQYGAFIENDCRIGKHSRIGTHAVLRRETSIGDYSIFGSLSASEGKNLIGNHVLIHSQCHLTTGLVIEDYVFIAPLFVGANDPIMLHERRHIKKFVPKAPYVEFGARIGVGVVVNPNVRIGRESVVGSGSIVTRNVEPFTVFYGNPAKFRKMTNSKWALPRQYYQDFQKRQGKFRAFYETVNQH